MAIDAGIYSQIKPVPAVDPQDVLTGVLNTNTLIEKGKQQQQQIADDAATRQILQQYGGDKQHVIDALRAKGLYAPADAIEKADIANRKARADAMQTAIKAQQDINMTASSYIQSAIDDPTPESLSIAQMRLNALPLGADDTDQDRQALNQQLTALRSMLAQSDFGSRNDGSPKGSGFLGVLKRPDGKVSSELSMGTTDVNGQQTEIPLLVPTLTRDEVNHLLSNTDNPDTIPQSIRDKAVEFARQRASKGQPFFAQSGEQQNIYPDLPRSPDPKQIVKATLQKWHDGLLSEKQTQDLHLDLTKALLGDNALPAAASIVADATDPDDYAKEYQTVLSAVPDRTMRASIAQSLTDPSQVTTPETFQAAIQKAKALSTTTAEKATIANQSTDNARQADALKEAERHNQAMEKAALIRANKPPASAASASPDDAKIVAEAIINGEQPPVLTGLYRNTMAVKAELAKNHYPQAQALEDWNSTQKLLGTLNGVQQTRLRQSIQQVSETVPVIRDLVNQWDAGKFPVLNRATLSAAKNGAMGQKAQSIATRLDAQIADMTSELGTVYKGGNTSTDESLALASKNLQSDWSKQTALDALDQIETNIRIRNNSLKLAPVGSGGTNPYEPRNDKPTENTVLIYDPKTGTFKKGGGE